MFYLTLKGVAAADFLKQLLLKLSFLLNIFTELKVKLSKGNQVVLEVCSLFLCWLYQEIAGCSLGDTLIVITCAVPGPLAFCDSGFAKFFLPI